MAQMVIILITTINTVTSLGKKYVTSYSQIKYDRKHNFLL